MTVSYQRHVAISTKQHAYSENLLGSDTEPFCLAHHIKYLDPTDSEYLGISETMVGELVFCSNVLQSECLVTMRYVVCLRYWCPSVPT